MRLAIDARHIESDARGVRPRGGVGRYVYRLIEQYARDPELELRLIVRRSNTRPLFPDAPRLHELPFHDEPNSVATEFLLARRLPLADCDLFHSPFQILPRGLPCPAIVTVHDLMWLRDPKLCSAFLPERVYLARLYGRRIRRVLTHADHIIAISNATQREIVEEDPALRPRISSVVHGVEPTFVPGSSPMPTDLPDRVSPGTPFVLCVGQGSPYKNHARATEAFLRAFDDRPELKLVLVRRFSRRDRDLLERLSHPQARDRIVCVPHVSDRVLLTLFQTARCLFFPSLKEGFGMPILEAMACGTPVLTSTADACTEVAGDAALRVDATDVDAMTAALRRLESDLPLRSALIAKGRERAASFTWTRCATQTLAAYQATLGQRGKRPEQPGR